jgi:hypothetical protein
MKIQRLKILVLGPMLLSLPMMCMHAGDGHHSGGHHSSTSQPSYQSIIHGLPPGGVRMDGMPIPQDGEERG